MTLKGKEKSYELVMLGHVGEPESYRLIQVDFCEIFGIFMVLRYVFYDL